MLYVLLSYISYPFVFLASRLLAGRGRAGSILVVQTAKIGDMICTTPVFREIKRAYPGCRLGVAADPCVVPLLKYNPHVDEIIPFERAALRGVVGKIRTACALYKRGYSSALVLMPNAANLLVVRWAMIPVRVAVFPDFAGGTLKRLLGLATAVEHHTPPRSAQETYLASLRHLGIREWTDQREVYAVPGADFSFCIDSLRGPGGQGTAPVGLVLGTGNRLKDWGTRRFAELAAMLRAKAPVVLIGPASEAARAERVMAAAGDGPGRGMLDLCGQVTLAELPALIERLSVVIGVDTGVVYMADALGVPVVDIAGPCDTTDQRPTGARGRVIQERGLPCVPCSHTFRAPYECERGDRACVTGITVQEVFAVADGMLEDRCASPPGGEGRKVRGRDARR